ncbi:MAG: hypothetical protein Greene07147_166 [Parcubacteria group bacterium Greene0714_7]|nr:MAG: hypothetical protein Greene07147_166 [Parcubacteria group bacterium Greene0714_7]
MKLFKFLSLIGAVLFLVPCVVIAVDMTAPVAPEMPAGPSISSVSVTDITNTSARIDINSDEVVQGYVEYGTSREYGMSTPLTSEFSTSPSFLLENLSPETLYHYRVIVMDSSGTATITGDETFTTLATPEPEPEPEQSPTQTATTTTPTSDTNTATSTSTTTATTTPPAPALAVSNTETASVSTSTVRITWQTNKNADGQVQYGTTSAYGSLSLLGTISTSHSISLSSLTPNTKYYYRAISKTSSGETAYSQPQTFTTLVYVPPTPSTATSTSTSGAPVQTATTSPVTVASSTPPVSNSSTVIGSVTKPGGLPVAPTRPLLVRVEVGDRKVAFAWKKDVGVKNATIHTLIVKKEGTSYVTSRVDGAVIYDGPSTSFTDTNVENGKEYHYALYSYGMYGRFTAPFRFKVIPRAEEKANFTPEVETLPTPALTRDLFQGKQGEDVKALQTYLAYEGYYPEALITGYFGILTKNAVTRYQKLNDIIPMAGYVGPITREALGR